MNEMNMMRTIQWTAIFFMILFLPISLLISNDLFFIGLVANLIISILIANCKLFQQHSLPAGVFWFILAVFLPICHLVLVLYVDSWQSSSNKADTMTVMMVVIMPLAYLGAVVSLLIGIISIIVALIRSKKSYDVMPK